MGDLPNYPQGSRPLDRPDAVPAESLAWLPGGPLPAALETGHKSIDFEHRQLLACMTAARSVCEDIVRFKSCGECIETQRARCDGELVRLLGDLLSFILEHFKTEEEIMRDSLLIMVDRDLCEAHMEDHAAISQKVQQIVSALDPTDTVSRLRELDDLLGQWMTNHIALHDMILARWIERQGNVLDSFAEPGFVPRGA